MRLGDGIYYAFVRGNHIQHAGRLTGQNGDLFWLVGKGLKSYPYYGLWVDKAYLRPLEEVKDFPRRLESYSKKAQRAILMRCKNIRRNRGS